MLKNTLAAERGFVAAISFLYRQFHTVLSAIVFVGLASLSGFSLEASAQAPTGSWVNLAGSVKVDVAAPVRNPRLKDATVKVTITNTSAGAIQGPVRLVLKGLTSGVSLAAASGGTTSDPYILVLNTELVSLAPSASKILNLTIVNGVAVVFSFTPLVEKQSLAVSSSSSSVVSSSSSQASSSSSLIAGSSSSKSATPASSSLSSSVITSSSSLSGSVVSSISSSSKSAVASSSAPSSSSAASSSKVPRCDNNATNYPQCDNAGLAIMITEPKSLLTIGHSPLKIKGKINRPNAILVVNGNSVTHDGSEFAAEVTLQEGYNTIVASATDGTNEQVTDSIAVSLDLTPPYVTIDSHTDGQEVSTSSITVTGLVNDIVRGTIEAEQAQVRVNGIVAEVSNRSYSAKNVVLVEGINQIRITAADQVGNTETKIIKLTYTKPKGQKIILVSGQDQVAAISTVLPKPLVVKLVDTSNQPIVGGSVIFRVMQDSGEVAVGTAQEGRAVVVKTNAQGEASTQFRLGLRTGTSNNKVRAVAVGYESEVVFNASATTKLGNKLSVNSGNNQRGVVAQALPAPLVTVVTDEGANVVKGARVRYDMIKGNGHFGSKETSVEVVTDSDGRATARFILGDLAGLDAQQVRATLIDAPEGEPIVAGFSATGFVPADPGLTTISGVVLDNQDRPIPSITMHIEGSTRKAQTNDQGQFVITSAPVGPIHLIADGSTASVAGEFPNLSYHLVAVAGVDNPLPAPIYMVKLNTKEAVYAGKQDVAITLEKFPGFKLEIAKNSVTFPDGSHEGYISVTAVNASAVPMAPPNGMQPQFIVTIQPTGTRFDAPARLSLPNVDGHAPGAQVEMYSYDHDLEEFVSIGVGSVTEDGSVIRSNPGVGVVKAGWHCGSQPGGSGTAANCPTCFKCDGTTCVNDPAQKDNPKDPQVVGDCKTATCGGSKPDDSDVNPADKDCKECKNGAPSNKNEGATCDDGKFCTSADGYKPGADKCEGGKCKGLKLQKEKTDEKTFEVDFGKWMKYVNEGIKPLKTVLEVKGEVTGKFQRKEFKVNDCCETTKSILNETGYETNGSIDYKYEGVSPPLIIPTAIGNVNVRIKGAISGSLKAFENKVASTCADPDKCNEQAGVQLGGKLGVGVELSYLHPNLISLTGEGSAGVSGALSKQCDQVNGKLCAGPVELKGTVKALSFVSYSYSYFVPNSFACTSGGSIAL